MGIMSQIIPVPSVPASGIIQKSSVFLRFLAVAWCACFASYPNRTLSTVLVCEAASVVNGVGQAGTGGDFLVEQVEYGANGVQKIASEATHSQMANDGPKKSMKAERRHWLSVNSGQARSKQQQRRQPSPSVSINQHRSMQEEKTTLPIRSYTYGNIHQTAYYFADVIVGTPAKQRQSLILDTGSSVLAFPCTSCKSCGRHMDPPFDCSSSSTCQSLPCSSTCTHCDAKQKRCAYRVSYMEGSSLQGFWHEDRFRLLAQPRTTNFGCHVQETELFVDQKASGIWGLEIWSQFGPDTYMTRTLLNSNKSSAVAPSTLPEGMSSFALCLAEHGGAFSIGDANGELHTSDTVLLDSGTTMSYFPTRIYEELVNAIEDLSVDDEVAYELLPPSASPRQSQAVKVESTAGELCFYLPKGRADLSYFPDIWLHFQPASGWVRWQPASYLYTKGNEHYRCVAMSDDPRADSSGVLGSSFFIGHDLIFDVRNEMIGIAEARCPGIKLKDRPKELPL
ncbi:hypothetical protein BESB_002360 [Besnoitia besnoiti]|uniref:Peptidase A1 domain-containing protein n=1 Tax=Besnoitia besnoiti TaxID=94643 RepID=A0A2A9MIT7_BESBE|nr:hypothetical protein BESB_002360 [Besnoitia besnoiti]PFH37895.1 hypothetical protein BESB_002360 [Besnoitia besnoiti]